MKLFYRLVLGAAAALTIFSAHASGQPVARARVLPPIPYTEFALPNGLRVILHEDHRVYGR